MYHFVAFLWNLSDPEARTNATRLSRSFRESASGWSCVLSADGIVVYAQPPRERALRTYALPNKTGVVLGKLFPRDPAAFHPAWSLLNDERGALEICRTGGRRLVDSYWGSYVAFLAADDNRASRMVIRDPSGRIPCYRMRRDHVEIVFSDIGDLTHLDSSQFSINHRYLAAFIYSCDLQVRECGLNETTEILAGECFELRGDSTRQFALWDPRRICEANTIEDYDQALTTLRTTTQSCIDAWSSAYSNILHRLSGGLDSAIVLGCLRRSPSSPVITCLNIYSENPGEDERRHARLAASHAGVSLVEQTVDLPDRRFDDRLFNAPDLAKPSMLALMSIVNNEFTNRIAAERRSEVVWTGEGGDHLFWQAKTAHSAADYLAKYGIGWGLPAAISDAARLSKVPYISVLRTAWKLGRSRAPWVPEYEMEHKDHFVNREALPENILHYVAPPWADAMEALPKGKQLQIYYLADVLHRHRPLPHFQHAYHHHPLLSQPLVELCLQIPNYLLVKGGRQRAMARDAFKDRVPTEILKREDKGAAVSSMMDMMRRSEPFLREFLLDGVLVKERIVSREALEPYIAQGDSIRSEHSRPLFSCIAGELWARSWTRAKQRAAAKPMISAL